jgi:hypothetical protein
MGGHECEKLDQAALPGGEAASVGDEKALFQSCSSGRRIGLVPKREPSDDVGLGILRSVVIPKGVFDQAARINPVAIGRANRSGAVCTNGDCALVGSRPRMAIKSRIRPRHASRLCHRQAAKMRVPKRLGEARRNGASSSMVRPPPIHPDRLAWGSIRR